MHPAYSVIFFTVASGLGYGLMMWLGLLAPLGLLPPTPWFGLAAFALAFGAAAFGMLASTFHLGHPERAWRAFSQWRSSWLSREGVSALAAFVPALIFGFGWIVLGRVDGAWAVAGGATAAVALVTVWCTGMIYRSLPTIRAWDHPLVVPVYLAFALMTGALALAALGRMFGVGGMFAAHLPLGLILLAWVLKAAYWRSLDRGAARSTAESATGLGGPEARVRLLDAPHTEENYIMREMGYRVARKHARRLRATAQALAFAAPLVLIEGALLIPLPGLAGDVAVTVALASALAGTLVERWLFFAEARHVVTLYYGAARA